MNVTTGNKNTSEFILRCAACGLFLADATSHFDVVAVTYKADKALTFPDGEAAENARKFMKSLYSSFDWRAVERDVHLRVSNIYLLQQQAA
ncbi:hypothetical protein [Noviherbaspirillum sp. Root189]|uniref:hypothetical protein n=1 Tax=Noviherbaspirillum sp. Root189 TaxID=1736487 RepID=UPI00070E1DCA|nr:hypothetical protein [Noviherbaspirillum sp. Root189]KRB70485.1 hypothetical protein ASE07_07685 [Noviherbaspirillum sp. Root189]